MNAEVSPEPAGSAMEPDERESGERESGERESGGRESRERESRVDDTRPGRTGGRRTTSLAKGLALLSAFRGISPPLGVSELARRSGLPKSTAYRFLSDMEEAGFVERDGPNYRLGLTLFELGSRVKFCRPNGLRDTAMHHMSRLHVDTGLNVHLGLPEGNDVVYIAKVNHGQQTLRGHLQPGARVPANCSALGKAILAFSPPETIRSIIESGLERRTKYSVVEPRRLLPELARVRREGVAFEQEETTLGVAGVAAPIMLEGRAVAAVSVSLRPPLAHAQRIAVQVKAVAAAISREHAAWSDSIW